MNDLAITRRTALVAGASLAFSPSWLLHAADKKRTFKIGACDWSIGKRGDVDAMKLAREIGLDGVQVSFGPPGEKYDLRSQAVRKQYQDAAKAHGTEIASLALGVLNSVPFSTDDRGEQWVSDCIDVMPKLNQKVVLLAFFSKGDIKGKPDLQKQVIARLKRLAPKAEKAGVVIGLETWLNVDDHLRILDAVGSNAVQVYYDTANMEKQGYDIYAEIRRLGKERICEIHCKENGFLLGKGRCDFRKVKQAVDDIGWQGWLVIEGAVPRGGNAVESYKANQKFVRSVFG